MKCVNEEFIFIKLFVLNSTIEQNIRKILSHVPQVHGSIGTLHFFGITKYCIFVGAQASALISFRTLLNISLMVSWTGNVAFTYSDNQSSSLPP